MPEEKDPRVILPMSRELLQRVDDFRFENRLNSRAEAIRRLLESALKAAKRPPAKPAEARRAPRRSA
jgi:metal-responsive CopG/Arc/MetJ family transcriptional regulator